MTDPERIRKLAARLVERRSPARLTAEAALIASQALRVYADMLERPKPEDDLNRAFVVEMVDDGGSHEETLAKASNALVARAAFEEACRQRPGRNVLLRQGARVIARSEKEGSGS